MTKLLLLVTPFIIPITLYYGYVETTAMKSDF